MRQEYVLWFLLWGAVVTALAGNDDRIALERAEYFRMPRGTALRKLARAYTEDGEVKQIEPIVVTQQRYLYPGMFGNLNNQRQTLLNSIQMAKEWNLTLVLPYWQLDFDDPPMGEQYPFSHFYQVSKLREYAHLHGFDIVEKLPEHLWPNCAAQLRRALSIESGKRPNAAASYIEALNKTNLICLTDKMTFQMECHTSINVSDRYQALPWLQPSDAWKAVLTHTDSRMEQLIGPGQSYVAVHARVEDEWLKACKRWKCRFNGTKCWVSPNDTLNILRDTQGLPLGSNLLVLTGAPASLLHGLCGSYKCVTKAELLEGYTIPAELRWDKYTTRAFLDFLLANGASALYGNKFSTFSTELEDLFRAAGKGHAVHYMNPKDGNCVGNLTLSQVRRLEEEGPHALDGYVENTLCRF